MKLVAGDMEILQFWGRLVNLMARDMEVVLVMAGEACGKRYGDSSVEACGKIYGDSSGEGW